MEGLITGNEFVGKGQSRHKTPLLNPINRGKGRREKEALHHGEGDETSRETTTFIVKPLLRPLEFLGNTGEILGGLEETGLLLFITNIRIYKETITFTMNGLYGDLEGIEGPSFRYLDFVHKTGGEIIGYEGITTTEKCENHLDEILFVGTKLLPIL